MECEPSQMNNTVCEPTQVRCWVKWIQSS